MFLFQIYSIELSHAFFQWHFHSWMTGFSCALPLKHSELTIIYSFRHLPKKITSEIPQNAIYWLVSQIVIINVTETLTKQLNTKLRAKEIFWILVLSLFWHTTSFAKGAWTQFPIKFIQRAHLILFLPKPNLLPKNDFLEHFAYNRMWRRSNNRNWQRIDEW